MSMKKSFGIAFVTALALGASGAALAHPINVDGVFWDTSSPFDLTIQSLNLRETSVSKAGDVLHGYGQIGSINGSSGGSSSFCSGCELNFTFTYTLDSTSGNQAVFNLGSFQFYVAPTGTFSFADPTSASIGTPWLTLTGHTFPAPGFADPNGQLYATVNGTVSNPTFGSLGFGLVDATSGAAAPYLDTNSVSDGVGGWADFSLTSSFQYFPAKGCASIPTTDLDNICSYPIEGNGSLTGRSTTIPEPGEIGLLGLGLGALALMIRRRRKEIEE